MLVVSAQLFARQLHFIGAETPVLAGWNMTRTYLEYFTPAVP